MSVLLRNTKKKLDAALRTIEAVEELDFPYQDSEHALSVIKSLFQSVRTDLEDCLPNSNQATVTTLCQRSLEAIRDYLPIIGFIGRSTDLDGPLELQGPLLRLTHRAIGNDAQLIISSEWEFSPFTILYPELNKLNFVLVGMPCSEANNALIAALAGHELGHNIWEKGGYKQNLKDIVSDRVRQEILKDWKSWSNILQVEKPEQLDEDLFADQILAQPWSWAIAQCEEVFCDFIGLLVFRDAYLHAFEYLLSPGSSGPRNYNYPRLIERVAILITAAGRAGIDVSDGYLQRFEKCEREIDGLEAEFGRLSDQACVSLTNRLLDEALKFVAERKLSEHDPDEVQRIFHAFSRAVPPANAKGIVNILLAGWKVATDSVSYLVKEYPALTDAERERILNELILKSFEVFEIEQRQAA